MFVLVVSVLSVGGVALLTGAQEEEIPSDESPLFGFEGPERAPDAAGEGEASGSPTFPTVWCTEIDDAETKATCWNAYRAGLDYYEKGLTHRISVFRWQHFSTRVIFVVVLLLVATGIFFAWIQFQRGDPAEPSELELSAKGVKITSPVIGLIILTLSLAFFYLYLVYVYPIHELI